jgi:hypothetical protein
VITDQSILLAQQARGEGIVKIGKVFLEKGDYKAAAEEHINEFYNYQEGQVLFKPTLAAYKQFRLDFEGAQSYFGAETAITRKIMALQSSHGRPSAGKILGQKSSGTWALPWATTTSRHTKAKTMLKS